MTARAPRTERSVFIAGRGLSSALGGNLPQALHAVRDGGVQPTRMTAAPGFEWPVFTLPDEGPSALSSAQHWRQQAQAHINRVAAECGAEHARHGPLFIATSSLDVGEREHSGDFSGDCMSFADTVAGWLDWQGPVFTVSTACTSSLNALHSAATLIRQGEADDALVLGLELPNRYTVAGFGAMQLLSPTQAQPLGAKRNGLVLGQAVAALRLSATPSRWRVCGEANVVDGRDPAGTTASAVVAMCEQALAASGLRAQDIDLIKPQAAGSPVNDAIEAQALQQVFGTPSEGASFPAWVSLKSYLGHTLGAAGAAEIALLTACLEAGVWPTPRYPLDPALGLSLNPQAPTKLRHLLANIVGFGGGHAAVVLAQCP